MDYYFLASKLCIIAVLVFGCLAQDDIEVKFDMPEDTIYSEVGAENIQLNCVLNRGPIFVTMNRLEIIHRNPVTNEERVMSLGALLEEGAEPQFYDVKIDTEASKSDLFHVVFTIKSVRDQDDGPFICKATETDTGKETRSEMEFIVVRPVEAVELHFDNHAGITKKPVDAVAIDAGTYPVKCMAKGANPGVKSVELFFDSVPVETSQLLVQEANDTEYRTFVSSITAMVDIMVKDTGKELQCVAKDSSDHVVTSALGIVVNTYDPIIICNETSAHVGQMNPVLTCTVNHTDIVVENFAFQMGKTGELIKEGEERNDNMDVYKTVISEGVTEVSLHLHKAKNWHFEEDFYIIIYTKGGHTTKERISLMKLEIEPTTKKTGTDDQNNEEKTEGNDPDAASMLDSRLALLLSILMSLLVQLF